MEVVPKIHSWTNKLQLIRLLVWLGIKRAPSRGRVSWTYAQKSAENCIYRFWTISECFTKLQWLDIPSVHDMMTFRPCITNQQDSLLEITERAPEHFQKSLSVNTDIHKMKPCVNMINKSLEQSSFQMDLDQVENCSVDRQIQILYAFWKPRGFWCYEGALVRVELVTCIYGSAPSMQEGKYRF